MRDMSEAIPNYLTIVMGKMRRSMVKRFVGAVVEITMLMSSGFVATFVRDGFMESV